MAEAQTAPEAEPEPAPWELPPHGPAHEPTIPHAKLVLEHLQDAGIPRPEMTWAPFGGLNLVWPFAQAHVQNRYGNIDLRVLFTDIVAQYLREGAAIQFHSRSKAMLTKVIEWHLVPLLLARTRRVPSESEAEPQKELQSVPEAQ
jgi:hypothetical protein